MLSLFNRVRIDDIETDVFNSIIDDLIEQDWNAKNTYNEFNAWIDYGRIVLRRKGAKLIFEWDNWTEGVVKGPNEIVSRIASDYDLKKPTNLFF